MTKLIIQIPCFNEEQTLGTTLSALPRSLANVDVIEWLVINDGSTDRTVDVAREHGVQHIVSLPKNQGLARAFLAGLEASLRAGADIIVNTDADNQYCADDIPVLIRPILTGEADIVIGARPIKKLKHFSPMKRLLQRLGSWVVRTVSRTDIEDAPSGFRAISRRAALQINVFSDYTYTLEMIIQAGQKGIPIISVPVRANADQRPSRLVKSIPSYVRRSLVTMLRVFMAYHPLKFFLVLGAIPFSMGFVVGVRWLVLFLGGTPRSHVPSLVLAAILLIVGFQLWILGLVGDVMAVNRKILEETQLRLRRADLDKPGPG